MTNHEMLKVHLSHIYCHNCKHDNDEDICDDCHRKNIKWQPSNNFINEILESLEYTPKR